jgi:hypothetical protein
VPVWALVIKHWKLAVSVVGLLAAFIGGYNLASSKWQDKYDRREIEIERQVAIEEDRQYQANQRAKEIEQRRIEEIQRLKGQLDVIYEDNLNEANVDPDRDRIGISIDGVQRLDRIK